METEFYNRDKKLDFKITFVVPQQDFFNLKNKFNSEHK